jgi:hypothetical protein
MLFCLDSSGQSIDQPYFMVTNHVELENRSSREMDHNTLKYNYMHTLYQLNIKMVIGIEIPCNNFHLIYV